RRSYVLPAERAFSMRDTPIHFRKMNGLGNEILVVDLRKGGTITPELARQLAVEHVRLTWLAHEVKGAHVSTRVSIAHAARLPYVVVFSGGKVSCYEKKGYEEWTGEGGDPRCVPLPAQQLCDLGLLQRLQSVAGLREVEGIIAIEPRRVAALEEGERLTPAYAAQLAGIMLALAEEAEKPAFPLPLPKKSAALS
ncbi:MAG: hypothetical protein WD645_03590, partial [Dehalococcoidia bacterium]